MITRGYVETGLGQVHLRRAGHEGPVVVLLHETPLSSAAFAPALPELGRWCRAVALDTPGYGMSDPPPAPPELAAYAGWLAEAIREVTDEPVLVCGVHTGASLAVELARQAPAQVAGLVLVGLPVYPPEQRARLAAGFAPELTPDEAGGHLRRAWQHYQRIWPYAAPAEHHRAVVEMLAAGRRADWAYRAVFGYDLVPVLAELRCPTLTVAAQRERLRPATERVAAELGLPFVAVEGAAGQLPVTRPARFSGLLREFATGGYRERNAVPCMGTT